MMSDNESVTDMAIADDAREDALMCAMESIYMATSHLKDSVRHSPEIDLTQVRAAHIALAHAQRSLIRAIDLLGGHNV